MTQHCKELRYALWFPVYMVIYLAMEKLFPTTVYSTVTTLDAFIPFCEWFVIPYSLWYPLLIAVAVYLLRFDVPAYRRYMAFLAATFFLSELIWLLYPNGQSLRPLLMPRDNPLTALIALIYSADTCTNVFPSVHVVGSVGAFLAVWDCVRLRVRHPHACKAVSLLAALICLSTVFIKQHAALDVLSGLSLSLLVAVPIYARSPIFRLAPKWV